MYRKRYMGDLPLLWGMNYNQLASDNPKIERICHYGRRTRKTNCTAAQRITMQTAPATKPWPKPLYQDTRPATICAPRGGQRCKPRPEPRRHHLPHAADTGHTSPQRRHQYKAPCIVPLPGAAAATYSHNQSHPAMYQSTIQSRVALFFLLWQKLNQDRMESECCVINRLRNRWDQCQRQICVHS